MSNVDFATMTQTEALDALADLDARKWGEDQREPSRDLNRGKSRGLLINAIIHHPANEYGDAFDAATKKAAKAQLTAADKAALRKGG